MQEWLIITVSDRKVGVRVDTIEQAVAAATLIPLTDRPDPFLMGFLNFHGELIPVYDLYEAFGFKSTPLRLSDPFVICRFQSGKIALRCEGIEKILSFDFDDVEPPTGHVNDHLLPGIKKAVTHLNAPIFLYDWEEWVKHLQKTKENVLK